MSIKPTYEELLNEIAQLKQQLEEKKKLEKELEIARDEPQHSIDQQSAKLQEQKEEYEAINEELRQTNLELSLAKEKAEKNERLYRKLIENSPLGMHFYKFENNSLVFTGANPAASRLLHVDNSQFIGKTIEEAFPPLVNTEVPLKYREAAEKGILWTTEQITYDDNKIAGAFEVIAFQTSNGNMVAIFNDITERKQYEKQLKEKNDEFEAQNEEYQQLNEELSQTNEELINTKNRIEKSEERFRLMLQNSNDSFVLVNKNGEQFFISDAAIRDTGFTIEELLGPIQKDIYPPDLHLVMKAWEKVLNNKNEVVRLQFRHRHKYKDYVWFEAAAQNHLDNPSINAVVINVRDISDIKETEAKLIKAKELAEANELKIKQQAEEIENFFNCAIDLLCIANTDGYFERLNQEWQNALGYTLEELKEKRFLEFVHPDDVPATLQVMSQLVGQNKVLEFINRYRCKDGSYRWIEWRSYPHENKIFAAARDITERKQTEEEFQLQRSYLITILENLPGLVWLKDTQGKFLATNRAFAISCGLNEPELLQGKNDFDIWASDLAEKYWADDQEVMKEGKQKTVEELISDKGQQIWFETFKSPVRDEQGFIVGTTGYARDITERKRVEEELRKNEILTRTAIENLPIIFYMIDKDGLFKLSIGAGLQSLGLQPNQVVGISAFELYKDYPHIIEGVKMALSGEMATFESNVSGASHFNIVTPFSISNKKDGIVGVALDITERKRIEHEAILAKEKAEENDRLKTAFLQNMSHEIRTPMNAIMGFTSLMAENYNNREKLEQYSNIIDRRCNDLLAIINDILDISKIESGQSTLHIEECNINEVFTELALFFADYQNLTNKQHIQLLMHKIMGENIVNIKTDKLKLKQILINLITNAFKFTETGTIECGCKLDNNKLLFHVSDTGIGIPVEKHEFVFDRFYRIDTVVSRNYVGGTGLGLPIVKGLTGLLGGKVWLESECYKGSTFYFTINYQKVNIPNPISVAPAETSQHFAHEKNLLIVEDDECNAMYLQELLNGYFSNIYVAKTGQDAIKLVHDHTIDIVLMDVRLPDITGYEATNEILKHFPTLKIIAQTAYAANDERYKALEAGCVDYISKPTKRELLLSIISKYLK